MIYRIIRIMLTRRSLLALLLLRAASAFTATRSGRRSLVDVTTRVRDSSLYSEESSSSSSDQDGDLFASDPASTTPEFLSGLWHLIAKGNHMVRGVSGEKKKRNVPFQFPAVFFFFVYLHFFLNFPRHSLISNHYSQK